MPPMRKVELDKAAWAWCNEVEPENISDINIASAYRLNVPKCGVSKCRRNCRGNPFCLNGLGESKWMSDPVEELDDDDLDSECRKPQSFVGLRNLGATCYINSLLQLWFHNIAFRNAILRWNPQDGPTDNSAIAHLQFLFTLMQFGKKKSVDPKDFVSSLEIDVSTQQDAREFSQLFISYLEDYLKRQCDPVVRNVVNNNFQGHYNYVTRCSNCKTESIRESTFYELEVNVKGHRTLDESIAEFLKEEKLEGADKYSCSVCASKQEATRHIELTALPPVFNLQLIRFIYDRQKEMKKKINSPFQFPENLDMGPYLKKTSDSPTSVMYNLFAVLIHKGPSANSGHYVAHICDQTSGNWYMFNDETSQKIEGKKLKLNSDEDYEVDESAKKQKVGKAIKGYLSSSNAYMLVYTASNSGMDKTPLTEDSLQDDLKAKLQEYNDMFDSMISQSREEKRTQLEDENIMKVEMASFLNTLPVDDNGQWEAISVKWLTNWIAANRSSGFYKIDNNHICCPHFKINPNSITELKFVNKSVAANIFEKYGGGPRLDENSLCKECVKLICINIRTRTKISNDQKDLTNLLKAKDCVDSPAFWVGKESLRTWRTKAIKSLNKDNADLNEDSKKMESMPGDFHFTDYSATSRPAESCGSPDGSKLTQNAPLYSLYSDFQADNVLTGKRKRHSHLLSLSKYLLNNLTLFISFISNNNFSSDSKFPVDVMHPLYTSASLLISNLQKEYNSYSCSVRSDYNVLVKETVNNHVSSNNNDVELKAYIENNSLSPDRGENSKENNINCVGNKDNNEMLISDTKSDDSCGKYGSSNYSSIDGANSQQDDNLPSSKRIKLNLDDDKDKEGSDDGKMNGSKSDEDEDEEYEFNFNEDIICCHENLCVEESTRKLVSEQAWIILRNYFPECREFPAETEPCMDCQCLVSEGKVAKDLHKQQAAKEKELLGNLYLGKNRPKDPYLGVFRILSIPDFIEPWRKFLREPTRREPLTSLRNNNLICYHEKLRYNPAQPEDFAKLGMVTDEEWEKLSIHFKVDREITLEFEENGEIISSPAVCHECVAARIAEEQLALLKYTKAKVYIRQIAKICQEDTVLSTCPNPNQQTKNKGVQMDSIIRRSSRNRRNKGEKEFTISSDQTLLDLKLQILNWLEVAPFDQHLILEDGKELLDHGATLASLNVFPDSVIYLKVDEPGDVSPSEEGVRKKPKFEPEHGFKGTGLLKR